MWKIFRSPMGLFFRRWTGDGVASTDANFIGVQLSKIVTSQFYNISKGNSFVPLNLPEFRYLANLPHPLLQNIWITAMAQDCYSGSGSGLIRAVGTHGGVVRRRPSLSRRRLNSDKKRGLWINPDKIKSQPAILHIYTITQSSSIWWLFFWKLLPECTTCLGWVAAVVLPTIPREKLNQASLKPSDH